MAVITRFISSVLDGSTRWTTTDTGASMVEEVSSTFDTVVNSVLTVHTVARTGLTDAIGVSHEARGSTGILTVATLKEFTTNAARTDSGGCVAGKAESSAITSRINIGT